MRWRSRGLALSAIAAACRGTPGPAPVAAVPAPVIDAAVGGEPAWTPAATPEPTATPEPEPIAVDAAGALRFRKLAELPWSKRAARAADLDRIVEVDAAGALRVIGLDGRPVHTASLPAGVWHGHGRVQLRLDGEAIEVVAIDWRRQPTLIRWTDPGGWTAPVRTPDTAELGSSPTVHRLRDGWLVLPDVRSGTAAWRLDAGGATEIPMAIGPGRYHGATQDVHEVLPIGAGAVVVVADHSSEDGAAVAHPGWTRGIHFAHDRFTELTAPLPWLGLPRTTVARATGGGRAAIVRRAGGGAAHDPRANLLLVDRRGRIDDVQTPVAEPQWLRWIEGVLVGWGLALEVWTFTPGAIVAEPIAMPAGTPAGWHPLTQARIGDALCTWGGHAHGGRVLGAVCLDVRRREPRLLTADPPRSYTGMCRDYHCVDVIRFETSCEVVADGAYALLTCVDDGTESLWIVEDPTSPRAGSSASPG
jgi:hypothetical protein